jgi:Eco57I restriction-modification methylase/restriction endonuclease TaqI-like protein
MNLLLPLDLPRSPAITTAVEALATSKGLADRGAVFTKSGVVEAILDLCGYTPDAKLETVRLLEPSFGDGDFLLEAIRRLQDSFNRSKSPMTRATEILSDAIRGVEVHRETFEATSQQAVSVLIAGGFDRKLAQGLVDRWLINDDFLLAELDGQFDFVVGNPPYVRQERIPAPLLQAYKWRYATLYDRADLYVLFYERGLDLLERDGMLGFICANRWIKNKYGGPLREKVDGGFHLKFFVDLERADAFHSEVIAYPAITVIQRSSANRTFVALGSRNSASGLNEVVEDLTRAADGAHLPGRNVEVAELLRVTRGRDPWLLDAPDVLAILRRLEHLFPTVEEAGAKVGIGVATGADRVFIGEYEGLPVEGSRKLPLVMAADCENGEVSWGGNGVINPFLESGELAPMAEFPQFGTYMEENGAALKRRHVARKQPDRWYKTIDRIRPQLTREPKLLIPDIKGDATVSYDEGHYYPHHNLYVVTSELWDLRALQAILRSSVALMFVAAYCVRMSGGFLRFQAQYLRRIRCPNWSDLDLADVSALTAVATVPDQDAVDRVVLPLYGLTADDVADVRAFAREARVPTNSKSGS